MNLHEIFSRNLADDLTVRNGMLITGIVILLIGIVAVVYGLKHIEGNEIQKSHACFGYALILLGIILSVLSRIPDNVIYMAIIGFFFFIVISTALINKIILIKEKERKLKNNKKNRKNYFYRNFVS